MPLDRRRLGSGGADVVLILELCWCNTAHRNPSCNGAPRAPPPPPPHPRATRPAAHPFANMSGLECGMAHVARGLQLLSTLCHTPDDTRLVRAKLTRGRNEATRRGMGRLAQALQASVTLTGGSTELHKKLVQLSAAVDPVVIASLEREVARLDRTFVRQTRTALATLARVMRDLLRGKVAEARDLTTMLALDTPEHQHIQRKLLLLRHFVKQELREATRAVDEATLHKLALENLQSALQQRAPATAAPDGRRSARPHAPASLSTRAEKAQSVVAAPATPAAKSGAIVKKGTATCGDPKGINWHMKPFSTAPWRWLSGKDGIGSDGDCFFDSLHCALARDTEREPVRAPSATELRRKLQYHVKRDVDGRFPVVETYVERVQALPPGDVPPWLRPLAASVATPGATVRDHRDVLSALVGDKRAYWADEMAIAYLSQRLNVMVLLVDSHRDVTKAERRFLANTVFVHTKAPSRIVVLKLSGGVRSINGHYQPLFNRETGRGCWTPATLPPFLTSRFCHGLMRSPWFAQSRAHRSASG